jgi:hypothetical protein
MRRVQGALIAALRVGLGAVMCYAAATKLGEPQVFAQDIANYRLLPPGAVGFVAASLPGIEALVGLALFVRPWARAAALATLFLLVLFSTAVGSALLRGIDVECGCFGGTGHPATWWTFARDLGLCAAAGAAAWRTPP